MSKKLTLQKVDRLLWLAHRRSRAKSRAGESWGDLTDSLEANLLREMRPHFIAILRLARHALGKV